jgi:hypothetical protein
MRSARAVWILLVLFLLGCGAAYSGYMRGPLRRMEKRDYAGALAKLDKPSGDTDKLLYRFEKGLILHYQGQYQASNQEFEKAERLIDRLYARSVSREVASLVTNDAARAYTGEEFERAFIHYYRALNYCYQSDLEGALVECRKANLKLADYAAQPEYQLTYKNDAFIQYVTGLLFAASGEWNDAYVSFKDAEKGYQAYQQAFGLTVPRLLAQDLARTAARMGYEDDRAAYVSRYGLSQEETAASPGGEVVCFAESGFIARKRQQEISLPLLEDDDLGQVWTVSDHMVYRYRHRAPFARVKYWVRVALPFYQAIPSQVRGARLRQGSQSAAAVRAEDLNAIALRTLQEKEDTILLRTAARALAKYALAHKAEKESPFLGALFNLLGFVTEAADTRSWLSLPSDIWVARCSLPPGTTDLVLELLSGEGQVVETAAFSGIQVAAGKPVFLSYRSYR